MADDDVTDLLRRGVPMPPPLPGTPLGEAMEYEAPFSPRSFAFEEGYSDTPRGTAFEQGYTDSRGAAPSPAASLPSASPSGPGAFGDPRSFATSPLSFQSPAIAPLSIVPGLNQINQREQAIVRQRDAEMQPVLRQAQANMNEPRPQRPQFDPLQAAPQMAAGMKEDALRYMAVASAVAAFAGAISRKHITTALNAFGGFIEGASKGRHDLMEARYKDWQAANEQIKETNANKQREYENALADRRANIEEKMATVKLIALKYHDDLMAQAAEAKNYMMMAQLLERNNEFNARMIQMTNQLEEKRREADDRNKLMFVTRFPNLHTPEGMMSWLQYRNALPNDEAKSAADAMLETVTGIKGAEIRTQSAEKIAAQRFDIMRESNDLKRELGERAAFQKQEVIENTDWYKRQQVRLKEQGLSDAVVKTEMNDRIQRMRIAATERGQDISVERTRMIAAIRSEHEENWARLTDDRLQQTKWFQQEVARQKDIGLGIKAAEAAALEKYREGVLAERQRNDDMLHADRMRMADLKESDSAQRHAEVWAKVAQNDRRLEHLGRLVEMRGEGAKDTREYRQAVLALKERGLDETEAKRWVDQQIRIRGQDFTMKVAEARRQGVAAMGGRESIFTQRQVQAAEQAVRDVENITRLNWGSSAGIFATFTGGPHMMDAPKAALGRAVTSTEVKMYNTRVSGLQRSLAAIESSGLAPPGSLTRAMEQTVWQTSDPIIVKMDKLAQVRQIVDSATYTMMHNPRVSPETREQIIEIDQRMQKAIPFTHADVSDLIDAQSKRPETTMREVIAKRFAGKQGSAPADAPTSVPVPPALRDRPDDTIFEKGGARYRKVGNVLELMNAGGQ